MTPCMHSRAVAIVKKLDAAIIVLVAVGLAFFGADRVGRSGPDRELLRQLKEMQEARREGRPHMASKGAMNRVPTGPQGP
jgi:hypothetical protein